MDDFLKPVKTTRRIKSRIDQFESLASNTQNTPGSSTSSITEIKASDISPSPIQTLEDTRNSTSNDSGSKIDINDATGEKKRNNKRDSTAFRRQTYLHDEKTTLISGSSLADDAREILKSQPDQDDLAAVLEYFQCGIDGKHDFNIKITSARSAQIINVLVTTTIPDIWPNFEQVELSPSENRMKKTLISCLSCTAGIGALITSIKQQQQQSAGSNNSNASSLRLNYIVNALGDVLKGSKTVLALLSDILRLYSVENQQRIAWLELIAYLAGGRILGTMAQVIGTSKIDEASLDKCRWMGDGKEYTRWLAKNITSASLKKPVNNAQGWTCLGQLLKRALSLGHKETLVNEIYTSLLLGPKALWTPLHQLLSSVSDYDKKVIFDAILFDLSTRCFGGTSSFGFQNDVASKQTVSAAAALISGLVQKSETLQEHLEEWIVVANASYATVGLATRRALIAVLATSEEGLERILTRALSSFADKLQIQHASSLQQDAFAQTILLAIGYLKRLNAKALKQPHISSLLMRSVSNRLAASIPRSRFLGMIIGVAYSKATDKPDQVLDFGTEEMEGEEAESWLTIPSMQDTIADTIDVDKLFVMTTPSARQTKPRKLTTKSQVKPAIPKAEIISIEEVNDSGSEDDDDLIPYAKPDSDPEDSNDDPTVINRSKPSAPVYIVDLIKQLQTTDKLDVIELALKSAPALIRRKIGFGSELTDNLHSLASVLVNLQDGMTEEQFQSLRLQSLIACVIAKPDMIAPSLAALYFEGDFSVSQRVVLLTAIGLSARELAGFKHEDLGDEAFNSYETSFPSKRLPAHLVPTETKQLQTQQKNPIAALTLAEAQSTIRPMALAAADKMTGPSVLKIRTFSSRMDVEKKREQKAQARTKTIPKNLHSLLVKSFYLPLCCRMSLLLSSSTIAVSSLNTVILFPSLTRMLLQTLTLVLHTVGPSASLHLPTLTQETLLLLLALHVTSGLSTDPIVLPALLHLLLALIDITIEAGYTAQERLITDHGSQVAELVNWANGLGDKIAVPDTIEEPTSMPWSVLAAGIQVKWFEMGQRFQGRMFGLTNNE